eukprot:GSChrysophyteH1.ASY1.ANO1.886.1 assembled CDS
MLNTLTQFQCALRLAKGRTAWILKDLQIRSPLLRWRSTKSSDTVCQIYGAISGDCGVKAGDTLVLCVSGGVDSIALLHSIVDINNKYYDAALDLQVITFDHRQRSDSAEDALFVRDVAQSYNLPFHLREWKSAGSPFSAASARGRNSEHEQKHVFNRGGIVTAHHADDQVETILLKLLRGSHLTKLHGMQARSPCGIFLKPALGVSKADLVRTIEDYGGGHWREDPSNATRLYKRNRVRHDAVPVLADIAGGHENLRRQLEKVSHQAMHLREWVGNEAAHFVATSFREYGQEGVLPVGDGSPFSALAPPVQSEVLRMALNKQAGKELVVDYAHMRKLVQLALSPRGPVKQVQLQDGRYAQRSGDMLEFQQKRKK